jgi:flagellar basal body-associated protein FliL
MVMVPIENMCPLLMIGYFAGGGSLPISDICCIREACQLWDEENGACSIKSIAKELSRVREQLSEVA